MAAWVPLIATAVSTIFSANQARQEGEQRKEAAEYQARQLEQNAGQAQAAAQRAAAERRREAQLAQSRALAVAAASGGGASDPTVVDIISDLNAEGTYRSMLELYEGDDRARLLRQQAASARYSGEVAAQAGRSNAVATIFKGATSALWMKYAPAQTGTTAPRSSYGTASGVGIDQ